MATQDQQKKRVEQFLAHLVFARKCLQLYPANSPTIDEAMAKLAASLTELFKATSAPVVLGVIRDQFFQGDVPVGASQDGIRRFATDLYRARVKVLTVSPGATPAELRGFLTLVCRKPEEILAAGGIAGQMAALELRSVSIQEAPELDLVDRDRKPDQWDVLDYLRNKRSTPHSQAATPPERETDACADPAGAIDAGELADFFLRVAEGSAEMARYLRNTLGDPARLAETLDRLAGSRQLSEDEAHAVSLRALTHAFRQIADNIASLPEAVRNAYAKNMAKALVQTGAPVRKQFLQHVLPAHVGEADVADLLIASFGDKTVAEILTNHVMFHKGTWRTVENFLTGFSGDEQRTAVIKQTVAANLAQSNEQRIMEIAALLGDRKPIQPSQEGAKKPAATRPRDEVDVPLDDLSRQLVPERVEVENMCQDLVEDCTLHAPGYATDLALTLQDQQGFGIFPESTIQLLDQALHASFARKRFDLIAHVLDRVGDHGQRFSRLQRASLAAFATDERLDEMVNALRFLDPAAAEYKPVVRILRLLGDQGASRLFDRLADEPDRSSRMFLLRLLVDLGKDVTGFLCGKIGHPQWFVVRNIAYVLGKVGSETALEPLTHVLYHPEPRVRSEVVQALGAIGSERVEDMMLTLLTDSDMTVAELAAGYLGKFDAQHVLPALRTMLVTDRKSLYARPHVAGRILDLFAQIGDKDELGALSGFRPSPLRFYSRRARTVAKECSKAMSRIKGRVGRAVQ